MEDAPEAVGWENWADGWAWRRRAQLHTAGWDHHHHHGWAIVHGGSSLRHCEITFKVFYICHRLLCHSAPLVIKQAIDTFCRFQAKLPEKRYDTPYFSNRECDTFKYCIKGFRNPPVRSNTHTHSMPAMFPYHGQHIFLWNLSFRWNLVKWQFLYHEACLKFMLQNKQFLRQLRSKGRPPYIKRFLSGISKKNGGIFLALLLPHPTQWDLDLGEW